MATMYDTLIENKWPHNCGEGWDVERAQCLIDKVLKLVENSEGREQWLNLIGAPDHELAERYAAAADEMSEVLSGKDNRLGYHLNHITTGVATYDVYYRTEPIALSDGKFYDSEAEAEQACDKSLGGWVEPDDKDAPSYWFVMYPDEEVTEDAMLHGDAGMFLKTFEDKAEAVAESRQFKYSYVVERDAGEFWHVVSNKNDETPFGFPFGTKARALTFLYKLIQPVEFMKLVEKMYTNYLDAWGEEEMQKLKEEEHAN